MARRSVGPVDAPGLGEHASARRVRHEPGGTHDGDALVAGRHAHRCVATGAGRPAVLAPAPCARDPRQTIDPASPARQADERVVRREGHGSAVIVSSASGSTIAM
jgi:hypothetical protein